MNRISNILGIKYPIIQAPLTWVTSAELVAAVSNAGGLGVLGPHAGQNTMPADAADVAERLRQEIRKTRTLTAQPFGVNYLLTNDEQLGAISQAVLQVLREEAVPVVVAVGEPNQAKLRQLKADGFTVIYRELTPTVAGAQAAEAAGADIIAATGFDAGGFTPKHPVGTMVI